MTNLLSLPRELRERIFELCLSHESPINPWVRSELSEQFTPMLLYTNKALHSEATAILYCKNYFDFSAGGSEDVISFLDTIGRDNSNYIKHVRVMFPFPRDLSSGNVKFEEEDLAIIASIQNRCSNLRMLTTCLESTHAVELMLNTLDHNTAKEALALVNEHFRAISSLRIVTVEVYDEEPNDWIRKEMERQGWQIDTQKRIENSGSDFDDYEDGWSYSDNSDDRDSYDIDNDSDFWRRAAD